MKKKTDADADFKPKPTEPAPFLDRISPRYWAKNICRKLTPQDRPLLERLRVVLGEIIQRIEEEDGTFAALAVGRFGTIANQLETLALGPIGLLVDESAHLSQELGFSQPPLFQIRLVRGFTTIPEGLRRWFESEVGEVLGVFGLKVEDPVDGNAGRSFIFTRTFFGSQRRPEVMDPDSAKAAREAVAMYCRRWLRWLESLLVPVERAVFFEVKKHYHIDAPPRQCLWRHLISTSTRNI